MSIPRQTILPGVAAAGSASLLYDSTNRVCSQESPNDRPVFAAIGLRNQGWTITDKSFRFAEFAALADVDSNILGENVEKTQNRQGKQPDAHGDYRRVVDRKDIDAVTIITREGDNGIHF